MREVECIIVGQGIAGTLVHHFLRRAGVDTLIINRSNPNASSQVAAGIINPVTGRQFVKSWMFDTLLDKALETYHHLEETLGIQFLHKKHIHRALLEIKDENTWLAKSSTVGYQTYMSEHFAHANSGFYDHVMYGVTHSAYHLDMDVLCRAYQAHIASAYVEDAFDIKQIELHPDHVTYKKYRAKYIIFCEGWRVIMNPYFKDLPFAPAKGEVLLCKIPNLKLDVLVKHHLFFVPKGNDTYWVGSNYTHGTMDENPTQGGKVDLINKIDKVLKLPYEVIDHRSGIRPATRYRRPMMGHHPDHPSVMLFNGLGTKGASLGPYWAHKFVHNILNDSMLEVNAYIDWVKRS